MIVSCRWFLCNTSAMVLASSVFPLGSLGAQTILASDTPRAAGVGSVAFSRVITIHADKLPLKRIVDLMAERANVRVQYRAELLDGAARPTTFRVTQMPLGEALHRLLAGTSLQAVAVSDDLITITGSVMATHQHTQGVIAGKVIHAKTRQVLSGVTVTVDDSLSAITDRAGAFRIAVNAGKHKLQARSMGFARHAREVTVETNTSVTIEIALDPTVSVLDEVTVTGSVVATERRAIPTPITVITAEDIERRGITRVEELLRGEVPGVLALERGVRQYDNRPGAMISSAVLSRGRSSLDTSANPLKTYVDGVQLTDPSYLGTIDPSSIERIEIVTGPQAATIYGSGAIGGVMQIFLKKGAGQTAPLVTANLRYGMLENSFSSGRTPTHNHTLGLTGGSGPAFSYAINGTYNYSGQWQPMLFNRSVQGSVGATHTSGPFMVSGTVTTSSGRNGTVALSQVDYSDEYGVWMGSPLMDRQGAGNGEFALHTGGRRALSQQIAMNTSQTVAFNLDYRALSFWQHHATVGRSQTATRIKPMAPDFDNPTDSLFSRSIMNGTGFNVSYNTTVSQHWRVLSSTFSLGLDGSQGSSSVNSGCAPRVASPEFFGCSGNPLPTVSQSDSRTTGGFANWQIGLFDQFFITAAYRGEQNPEYGSALGLHWTPRYGATYSFSMGPVSTKLLASYGRATRPPLAEEKLEQWDISPDHLPLSFISRLASPHLGPEYSSGPQGGIEVYVGNVASFTVNRYVQHVNDLIRTLSVDSIWIQWYPDDFGWSEWWPIYMNVNADQMRQHGWETTGSLNLWAFRMQGTYSWNDSRIKQIKSHPYNPDVVQFMYPRDVAIGQPTHFGFFSVSYARGGTSVTLNTNYTGSSTQRRYETHLGTNLLRPRLKQYAARGGTTGFALIKSPGYLKSGLVASHRINARVSATVNIVNLGNSYASDASQLSPTLGRQTSLGMSWRFQAR